MKRISQLYLLCCFVVLLGSTEAVFAQEGSASSLHPKVGAKWQYNYTERNELDSQGNPLSYRGYLEVYNEKDTIVDGYKVIKRTYQIKGQGDYAQDAQVRYIHYDGAKAYQVEEGKLRLLYDLGANVGDEVPIPINLSQQLFTPGVSEEMEGLTPSYSSDKHSTHKVTVAAKDTIEVEGVKLIRQLYRFEVHYAYTAYGEPRKGVDFVYYTGFVQNLGEYAWCSTPSDGIPAHELDDLFRCRGALDALGDVEMLNNKAIHLRCYADPSLSFRINGIKTDSECRFITSLNEVLYAVVHPSVVYRQGHLCWTTSLLSRLSLYDMSAREVWSASVEGDTSVALPLLPEGSYIYIATDEQGNRYTGKLIL